MTPSVRGVLGAGAVCAMLAAFVLLALPAPKARANVACDVGTGPVGAVTGAVGLGNPVGDACNSVTGAITAPVTGVVSDAVKGIGSDVFGQLTTWVSEGSSWLMGQVVSAIDESTTPRLDTEGFLNAYGKMAAIAAVLACAMLLLAILEGIAQGSPGLLVRVVLVNVPLAFLGTSLAFTVVQLLLGVTDGLSEAIASATHHDSSHFFESAIGDLSHVGGEAGKAAGPEGSPSSAAGQATGSVAVPLFVAFLAAIVGAFAAFFVWIELLFRDAAVYVVALFMPLALAASIWPRWTGALRKSCEYLVALIGSKFVIVAIVSLAASLVAEEDGSVEHVLAAAALMSLACFAPFVLLRLIPFSEGALAAAYGRRSAAGGAISAVQIGSDIQILRNMGRSGEGSGVSLWSASEGGGGASGGGGGGGAGGGSGKGGSPRAGGGGGGAGGGQSAGAGAAGGHPGAKGAGGGAGAAEAGGGAAGAAAVPVAAAARGPRSVANRLSETAGAQMAGGAQGSGSSTQGSAGGGGAGRSPRTPPGDAGQASAPSSPSGGSSTPPRPQPETSSQTGAGEAGGSPSAPGERPPRPSPPRPPGGKSDEATGDGS